MLWPPLTEARMTECPNRCARFGNRRPPPRLPTIKPAEADVRESFSSVTRAHLIDLPDPRALDNVNTPEEYAEAIAALDDRSLCN